MTLAPRPARAFRLAFPTGGLRRSAGLMAVFVLLPALLAAAGIRTAAAASGEAPADRPGSVVVVGIPGLRWDDVSETGTPTIWDLLPRSSAGSLSIRAGRTLSCPGEGWLTVGAGNRARGEPHSSAACPPHPVAEIRPLSPAPSSSAPGTPDGSPAPASRGAPRPPAPATVPAFPGIVADNASLDFGAEPGALGERLRAEGTCAAAAGPGAALAAADRRGRVAVYTSGPATSELLRRCPVTIVEIDPLVAEGESSAVTKVQFRADDPIRARAVTRADAQLASVVRILPPDAVLLVVGVSETGLPASPRLHVALATGGPYGQGWLTAPSTRRAPFVQLIDVAPTALRLLGLEPTPAMVGQLWGTAPGRPASASAAVAELVDADRAAYEQRRLTQWFFGLLVLVQGALYLLAAVALRRLGHRGDRLRVLDWTAGTALAAAAAIVSTYLANLVPWWRAEHPLLALIGAVAVADAVILAIALGGPWRRHLLGPAGAVAGATAAVMALDLLTGARLQLSSMAGYSPLVAGRFAGIGNVAYGVFAAAALLFTAAVAAGRSRRTQLALVAAVGTATVVLDGSPQWGSDFGGVLASVPAFVVLGLLLTGRRLSWKMLLGAALVGLLVVSTFALLDYARPPTERTHLGRFVGQLLDGTAGTVVQRKAKANLSLLTHSPLTLLVPLFVAFLTGVLLKPWGGLRLAFEQQPALRAGLIATLCMGVVGFAVNDSGVAVPALAMTVAVPLAIAVSVTAVRRRQADDDGEPTMAGPAKASGC